METATLLRLISDWGLLILLPVTILEGPVATIIAGWLVRLAALPPGVTFVVCLVGDLIGDLMFYALGHQGARRIPARWQARLGLDRHRIAALSAGFARNGMRWLILAKLTQGAGAPVLAAAGAAGMRLGPFLGANLAAGAIKTAALMALGYSLGADPPPALVWTGLGLLGLAALALHLRREARV